MAIRRKNTILKSKKQSWRLSIYLDDEFKNELYPRLKELARKETRSINYLIKKAVKQFLVNRKLVKPVKL
ncbi:MAG: ribbon-helix-helix protein, CopG family [Verrucomicrobiota bacterium]